MQLSNPNVLVRHIRENGHSLSEVILQFRSHFYCEWYGLLTRKDANNHKEESHKSMAFWSNNARQLINFANDTSDTVSKYSICVCIYTSSSYGKIVISWSFSLIVTSHVPHDKYSTFWSDRINSTAFWKTDVISLNLNGREVKLPIWH